MSLERSFPHLLRRLALAGAVACVLAFSAAAAVAQEATHGAAPSVTEEIEHAEEALEEGHADPAHAGGAGMPQLETTTYLGQIFWLTTMSSPPAGSSKATTAVCPSSTGRSGARLTR